ncbi:MAG: hypothetical protein AAB612_03310 [Patescibacteria group bacterium]
MPALQRTFITLANSRSMRSHLVGIICATILSYVWIIDPDLQQFSLQLTGVLFLLFLVVQKFAGKRLGSLSTDSTSYELIIITTALFVLVGSTGGISSIFLPLTYGLLFLSVLTLHTTTIVTLTASIPLFLWAISQHALSVHDIATLLSFPALLPLLLFARQEHKRIQADEQSLESSGTYMQESGLFLSTFLLPKLEKLLELSQYPEHNSETLQRQILLILEATKDLIEDQKRT